MSCRDKCLEASKTVEAANKLDFLNKVKKATKQAAQKVTSNGLEKSNSAQISAKMGGVMGSFLKTPWPNSRRVPRTTEAIYNDIGRD